MTALKLPLFFLLINILPGLGLAFYLARKTAGIGIIDKLIIAVLLSPLVVVLFSFLEEAMGIPQSAPVLAFNLAAMSVANAVYLVRGSLGREDFALRMRWAKGFVYMLFVALLLYRVLPTLNLMAPILHDPIAHTEWLKQLNQTHFTTADQWYPQGLEYYLNYFATFLDFSYPRIMLVSANFILALFPISMFYLGLLIFRGTATKRTIFALIFFVVSARLAYPNEFYYIAGKNSMVFAFSIAPLLLFLATNAKNRWDYILAILSMFAVVVIHYPTGFFLLATFLLANLVNVASIEGKRLRIDRRNLYGYLTALAIFGGLMAVLAKKILPIYRSHPISEDNSLIGVAKYLDQNGVYSYAYRNFIEDQIQAYHLTPVIIFAGALAVFLLVRDNNRKFVGQVLGSYAILYLLGVLMLLAGLTRMGINYSVELRFFLVFILAIAISWFIFHVIDRILNRVNAGNMVNGIVILCLGLLFLVGGYFQYRLYVTFGEGNETVQQDDAEAFAFISNQDMGDRSFLIQMGTPSADSGVIAGADSGAWIPSFTDRKIEVDFLQFSGFRSANIFDLYMSLAKDGDDSAAVRQLYCDYDIGYIFFGSKAVYFNNMKRETLDESRYFEKIYDRGATIYRIKQLNCNE